MRSGTADCTADCTADYTADCTAGCIVSSSGLCEFVSRVFNYLPWIYYNEVCYIETVPMICSIVTSR